MAKVIRQHDLTDCGPACLAGIANWYGKSISVAQSRLLAGTDPEGTSLADLKTAAVRLGFQTEAVKGPYPSLASAPLPAIAHLIHADTGAHFVVLSQVTKRGVRINDPADGRSHRWSREKFESYWSGAVLLLLPTQAFYQQGDAAPPSAWSSMIRLVLPYRKQLFLALCLSLAVTVLAMGGAVFAGALTDHVIPGGKAQRLPVLGLVLLLAIVLQTVSGMFRRLIILRTGRLIDQQLMRQYCHHLLMLSSRFFHGMQTGELLSRLGDMVLIRRLVNDLLIQSGIPVIAVLSVLVLAMARHPVLALWLFISIGVYALVYLLSQLYHRAVQRRVLMAEAALDAHFTETFESISGIKDLGTQDFHRRRLDARIHDFLEARYRSEQGVFVAEEMTSLVAHGFSLILLWVGGALVLGGDLSLGSLITFYTVSGYFTAAASQLIPLAQHIQEARIAAERMYGLLDLPPEEPAAATAFEPENVLPVRLQEVRFGYREGKDILRGACMEACAGSITLISGASGSGKSTLLSLLMRHDRTSDGEIYLGDLPLESIHRKTIHRKIAIVPQHIRLLDDTFVENICPGRTPDLRRLEALCTELGLLPLIRSWAGGLDTRLGRDGQLLSGGQRQLLALARALYREPQLLLLDEATASLDREAERHVHTALSARRSAGMAIVWISHSSSSRILADKVYHMENGRLIKEKDRSSYHMMPTGLPARAAPDSSPAGKPDRADHGRNEAFK